MTYGVEVRARCRAALSLGATQPATSAAYGPCDRQLRRWMRNVRPKKSEDDLVLEYLREGLGALRVHARFSTDPEWMRLQRADSLAVFHGVLADKCARIYERLGRRAEQPDGAGDDVEGPAPPGGLPDGD